MHALDYVAILFYALAMVYIGIRASRGTKGAEGFQFGGKSFSTIILFGSLAATAMGSSSIMGQAGTAYREGISVITWSIIPWCIGWGMLAIISKKIRSTGSTSFCDLFLTRHGKVVGKSTSVLELLTSITACAVQIGGVGLLVSMFLGETVDYKTAVYIGTAVIVIYTTFGGVKGTIHTNLVQIFVIALGIVIAIPVIVGSDLAQTGLSWAQMKEVIGLEKFNPLNGITLVFWISLVIRYCFAATLNPVYYQSIVIAKDAKTARRAQLMGISVYLILGSLVIFLALLSNITSPGVEKTESVIINIALTRFPLILKGIFFAAVMSSLDGFLMIAVERFTINIVETPKKFDEKKQLLISRISCVVIGFIAMMLTLQFKSILAIVQYTTTISSAAFFFPFLLTLYWKRVTRYGVLAGIISGGSLALVFGFLGTAVKLPIDGNILANVTSMVLTVGVSLLTQKKAAVVSE